MLQAFIEWSSWWISDQNCLKGDVFAVVYTIVAVGVVAFLSWNYDEILKEFLTFWGPVIVALVLSAVVTAICIWLLPWFIVIAILAVIVYTIFVIFYNWGNKYREVVKMQDKDRLTALASLIESDPTIRAAYDKLMKDSEL